VSLRLSGLKESFETHICF